MAWLEHDQQDWRVSFEFYNRAGKRIGDLRYGNELRESADRELAEKEISKYRPDLIRATWNPSLPRDNDNFLDLREDYLDDKVLK